MSKKNNSAEQKRLDENAEKAVPLELWGPYLSERQWGTVREDYSANGDAWNHITHDHARSKAYRWGEDGLAGISDVGQNLCFAIALWNGKDPILKERIFGLNNSEGNHGEDGKELYYYLDNTPTHSYMKFLYKYPQNEFPYSDLLNTSKNRSKQEPEYELIDTGIFKENKYFDVFVEYAKVNHEDICIKIEMHNIGVDEAEITLLPTLWFKNKWQSEQLIQKPNIKIDSNLSDCQSVTASDDKLGTYHFYFPKSDNLLFTENETNIHKLYGVANYAPHVKDAFHDVIVGGDEELLKDNKQGTKFAPVYKIKIKGGDKQSITLRLRNGEISGDPFKNIENVFIDRKKEADEFYENFYPENASEDLKNIQRQAFAGLLWSKQYYHYDVERWLNGDPGQPPPPSSRKYGRNMNWGFLKNVDIISMPDTWEYPWYAAWDLAFHCIPMAMIDPVFAKNQLIIIMREWYMNPAGQIPAYEWNFSDVNPPVHAWAALCVYRIERKFKGEGDLNFLKRIFQKLLINFTWWVNRKDENGNNIFEGGFLGLDNIAVLDRSNALPQHSRLEQVDGTSWMAMYALNMMDMALEIAIFDKSFEDMATKFYEHFVLIAEALNEATLWDETDSFFYDVLYMPDGSSIPLKVHSTVGLSVLLAVSSINVKKLEKLDDFIKRVNWFKNYRITTKKYLPNEQINDGENILISLIKKEKLIKILQLLLKEDGFLSPGGLRAVSKYHETHPYDINVGGIEYSIRYDPGESTSGMFGGNSNWRGPVWFPTNYLVVKALKRYHEFYGDTLKIEFPTGSGVLMNLGEISDQLAKRLVSIFEENKDGNRPVHSDAAEFYSRPENKNLLLFYEYFHGDTSRGVGASHQTGWTAVVAELINEDAWEMD